MKQFSLLAQAIAAAGADALIIDQEHGPLDFETSHAMIAATQGTACAPLVRVRKRQRFHVRSASVH
jgi:4-hydroxy-2-oxoheptanedioate aldolase